VKLQAQVLVNDLLNKDWYLGTLYGVLLNACRSGLGHRILMENKDKQDGIRSWCHLLQQYQTDGNRNISIRRL
jgi:hypothetical protein